MLSSSTPVSAAHIWADRFDIELCRPFRAQDAITGRIASSLHIQLLKAEHRRAISERAGRSRRTSILRLHAMASSRRGPSPEHHSSRDRPSRSSKRAAGRCWLSAAAAPLGSSNEPWLAQSKPAPGKGFRGINRERQSVVYIASMQLLIRRLA